MRRSVLSCLVVASWSSVVAAQPGPPPSEPTPPEVPPTDPQPPTETPPPVEPEPPQPAPPIAVQTQPPPPPEPELDDEARQALANYEPSSVKIGGFIQARYLRRQDSVAPDDENGFALRHARLDASARTRAGNLDLSASIDAALAPDFRMLDAFATLSRYWKDGNTQVGVSAGQMIVPISRQQMLHDSLLAFVDKAQLASIAPVRDLGVAATASLGGMLRVTGGVYNGEGPNQVDNADQRYLWVTRVELSPFSTPRLEESAFGSGYFAFGLSYGRKRLGNPASSDGDTQSWFGVDVAVARKGFSGSLEYLRSKFDDRGVNREYPEDFQANGWALQASYLLPQRLPPYNQTRVELGARFEEIDRDDTLPIITPGDPRQSTRAFTAVANFYLRNHSLKGQLAYTHFAELEDRTAFGEDAEIDNDQLVLQITYRLE